MATITHLNKQLSTALTQLHVVEEITANGATPVTATVTYPRAFSKVPKIIGCNHDNDGSVIVSATSTTTVLTIQIVALSGNTDAVNASVSLEGLLA